MFVVVCPLTIMRQLGASVTLEDILIRAIKSDTPVYVGHDYFGNAWSKYSPPVGITNNITVHLYQTKIAEETHRIVAHDVLDAINTLFRIPSKNLWRIVV